MAAQSQVTKWIQLLFEVRYTRLLDRPTLVMHIREATYLTTSEYSPSREANSRPACRKFSLLVICSWFLSGSFNYVCNSVYLYHN